MREFYSIVSTGSPKRDIDLFGPTTVRIDGAREPGGAGVPVIYLSAYVEDAEVFAQRLCAALTWLNDNQNLATPAPPPVQRAAPPAVVEEVGPYSLPEYVEDVDWSERLFLPEDLTATDWRGWAEAFERRVDLATTEGQIAMLEVENGLGLKACPFNFRRAIGRKLQTRYVETASQEAA
ncbi:hypothetical protein [Brevundimonas sp. P7753]|uniref:hypothetical protein n=1 Tax=Brevundimonas sp. P7753 TaxID=2726982 RepID=UPI0015C159BF|nr:hypothetical protein [Brevundimonas sp. P7753]NWE53672.1 hypothetical protein [Brevundimonas sp. P7753]